MIKDRKLPPQAHRLQPVSARRPTQPPAPGVLQRKAAAPPARKSPAAPPVYKPQPLPKVLQRKTGSAPSAPAGMSPVAPPVYRPQPTPRVLQTKAAAGKQTTPGQNTRTPVAPPVYRPQPTPKVLQAKRASGPQQKSAANAAPRPTVYRPQNPAGVLQRMKSGPAAPELLSPRLALARTRDAIQAKFDRNMQVIQMVNIAFRNGKIKLPRLYQDQFERDNYIVADYIDLDDEPQYLEVNRMCNAMSVMWASSWGQPGNKGYWQYGEADRKTMAEWVAADLSYESQAERVQTQLTAADIGIENFGVLLGALDGGRARGVVGSNVHAMAFVAVGGKIQVYDSMDGEVIINETISSFIKNLDNYIEVNGWNSCIYGEG